MSSIQLEVEDLYGSEEESLSSMDMIDVFETLRTDTNGLSQKEAARRLELFGPNERQSKTKKPFLQFLARLFNPLSWPLVTAAILAIVSNRSNWPVFLTTTLLLIVYTAIGFFHQVVAERDIHAVMTSHAPPLRTKVKREGQWSEIYSAAIVPGDVVFFTVDECVPADCRLTDTETTRVLIDDSFLTSQTSPQRVKEGGLCHAGSICLVGEAEAVVISTGHSTFLGRATTLLGEGSDHEGSGELQRILAQIATFCLLLVGVVTVLDAILLGVVFDSDYHRILDNIVVIFIAGTPLALPTLLSIALVLGAQQLAKHHAIPRDLNTILELAGVTSLLSEKAGPITTNQLVVDKDAIHIYGSLGPEEVLLLAAYACETTEGRIGKIDQAILSSVGGPTKARNGIEVLDFRLFNPVDGRVQITYRDKTTGSVRRVTKGMTGIIIERCDNRTEELDDKVEADVEWFAQRALRVVAVAYEELEGEDPDMEREGNGFEFVGVLPLLEPPREDAKGAIADARDLGVEVRMLTHDCLATAKEIGRRVGLGDRMLPAKFLKEGEAPPDFPSVDEMVLDLDGWAGMFPEHKTEVVKRLQALGQRCAFVGAGGQCSGNITAIFQANVGIAGADALWATRDAADLVVTKTGLVPVVEAIRRSCVVLERIQSIAVQSCSFAVQMVIGFAVLSLVYELNFPAIMVLVLSLVNDGVQLATLALEGARGLSYPDRWSFGGTVVCAVANGVYLATSTITLVVVIMETTFFQDHFNLSLGNQQLNMVVYLQIAVAFQTLAFFTPSRGFWTSVAIIAVYGYGESGLASGVGWIGVILMWNAMWLFPAALLKPTLDALVVKYIISKDDGRRVRCSVTAWHESLYSGFARFFGRGLGWRGPVHISSDGMERFGTRQTQEAGRKLVSK
ncbi:hypothetical protein V5O48_004213 [Marasmius crinis-equi]|uniref:Plasma membrane ATPase n=1 Tax=Marasmius crinis-equi TaxID=585013 RepID=A0ABR3FQR8_9AGAR